MAIGAILCGLGLLSQPTCPSAFGQAAPTASTTFSDLPPAPAGPAAPFTSGSIDTYQPPREESRPLFENAGNFFSNPFAGLASPETPPGQRLFQNWGADMTWITASKGGKRMGMFNLDFSGEIAFPIFALERPLYIVPRFGIYYWDGPQSLVYDMSPQTFDASVGLKWCPQWKPAVFGGATTIDFDLFFSVGVFADFRKLKGDSFRFPSHAIFSTELTRNIHLKLGILYLDRNRYKILPTAGLVWTPNPQWEFQILFPNPRLIYRPSMANLRNLELYARGEYGGGSWTVKHEVSREVEQVDYNDYRIMFGANWQDGRRRSGYFEIGVACGRELYYRHLGSRSLDAGFAMSAGLNF